MSEKPAALLDSLTPMQRAFVAAKLDGATIQEAAAAAGYTSQTVAWELIRNPTIARAIEEGTKASLRYDMGPTALKVLHELASDAKQTGHTRTSAAKALSSYSGYAFSPSNLTFQKSVADMSADEIATAVAKLQATMADRAKDVTPVTLHNAPIDVDMDDPDVDLLG